MGIKPLFTKASVNQDLTEWREKVEADLVKILGYVGNKFVKDARLMTKAEGGFGDDTGNLRASIGYFILKDGDVIKENLKGKAEGKIAAQSVLSTIDKKSGYQLIGVAGMSYASEVESRGFNVISYQADTALIDLDRMLRKYASKLSKMGISFENSGN
jgi:hypothetical protein